MQYFVIVNPAAGNHLVARKWHHFSACLKKHLNVSCEVTTAAGHATELAVKAIDKGFRSLLVIGGDGTLNEVLNGIMQQQQVPTRQIALGMLPAGTGNDWLKSAGFSMRFEQAVAQLSGAVTCPHDVGVLHFGEDNDRHSRYFMNVAGFGFGGLVVKTLLQKRQPLNLSVAGYVLALLRSLYSYREVTASMEADGKLYTSQMFNLSIGHGQYFGGGMRILPDSLADDGLFDISMVSKIGRLKVAANLQGLFNGRYTRLPEVQVARARKVKVTTKSPVYFEVEGELLGEGRKFWLEVLPGAIQVFRPGTAAT